MSAGLWSELQSECPTRCADDILSVNPPLVIATYKASHNGGEDVSIDVVRDDLLFAGTKQRAAATFVQQLIQERKEPATRLLYTAPYNGFGPVAVAHCAQTLGLKCTLILTRRPISSSRGDPLEKCITSETVRRAVACGAKVLFADSWDEMRAKGFELYKADKGIVWIPIGLSRPGFHDALTEKIREAAAGCVHCEHWKRLFVVGGTGALGVVFSRAFPALTIVIVPATIDEEGVKRIVKTVGPELLEAKRVVVEAQYDPNDAASSVAPPYPSVPGYDAIVWGRVLCSNPSRGDVIWNVAGYSSTESLGGGAVIPRRTHISCLAQKRPRSRSK
jgi:hypothetical protein